jgi:hypoxanthine phosphoribosyltransferase
MASFRYITWPEYGRLTEALAKKVGSSKGNFELVVGLARGGIPVSMVVSDRLGTMVDFINVKSYHGIAKRGPPRIVSDLTEPVKGKRVLVVDDLVDEGDTLAFVRGHLEGKGPRSLETAVIFKKPWSKTDPDYFIEATEDWIVFPFEVNEVNTLRSLGGARSGSSKKGA